MKPIRSLLNLICQLLAIALLVVWLVVKFELGIPNIRGFAGIAIQPLFVLCLCFVILNVLTKKYSIVLPVIVLLVNILEYKKVLGFNTDKVAEGNGFSVLSFNVFFCDNVAYLEENKKQNAEDLTRQMVALRSDIKCFQEFFEFDQVPLFNLLPQLRQTHPYYVTAADRKKHQIGLVTFSKFPIVYSKYYGFEHYNGLLITDHQTPSGTVRVMNLQLNSMGIRVNKLLEATRQREKVKQEAGKIARKLRNGFANREDELHIVLTALAESPHPVVLVGDFNEVPFGRAYSQVAKKLQNSFEEKGRGFGFTLNRSPYMVRIDQIFHSEQLYTLGFKTLRDVPYSDHFPVWAKFAWK